MTALQSSPTSDVQIIERYSFAEFFNKVGGLSYAERVLDDGTVIKGVVSNDGAVFAAFSPKAIEDGLKGNWNARLNPCFSGT